MRGLLIALVLAAAAVAAYFIGRGFSGDPERSKILEKAREAKREKALEKELAKESPEPLNEN